MTERHTPKASGRVRWILVGLAALGLAALAGFLLAEPGIRTGAGTNTGSSAALEIVPRPARTHHALRATGRVVQNLPKDARDAGVPRLVWSVNGEDVGTGAALPAGSFRRGDEVRVRVEIPNPEKTLVTADARIVIANSPPHVRAVRLERDRSRPQRLTVRYDAGDPDDDPLDHRVVWLLDGEPWPGARGAQVDVSGLARGSTVTARVRVDDGETRVESAAVSFALDNRPPTLEVGRQPRVERADDGSQRAVLTARSVDPDGDVVRIDAIGAPPGVTWNGGLGALVWSVDDGTEHFDVTLRAEDDHGARAERTLTLAR
ncbi:MAG TPA: hypothetical protein VKA86_18645 [Candidatus Krumholzibacteria bacterium]|nr:hypothetical protein [Candidatus Krumholzibacteria bacterium]